MLVLSAFSDQPNDRNWFGHYFPDNPTMKTHLLYFFKDPLMEYICVWFLDWTRNINELGNMPKKWKMDLGFILHTSPAMEADLGIIFCTEYLGLSRDNIPKNQTESTQHYMLVFGNICFPGANTSATLHPTTIPQSLSLHHISSRPTHWHTP